MLSNMTYDVRGETVEKKRKRAGDILGILQKAYPNARIALKYANPFELLVAVVLSAQCTDKVVNKVTKSLFEKSQKLKVKSQKYKLKFKIITPELREIIYFAETNISKIEKDVKSTGFYRNKAKNIKDSARIILRKHNGKVPRTMDELINLPGVARKTANIILGNAFGIVEGIAIDTHVSRISQRLRLVDLDKIGKGKKRRFKKNGKQVVDFKTGINTDKIEKQLMEIIPKRDWFQFPYLIIDHGRAICTSQNPKCADCVLNKLCPVAR
jgi:endonuclease-3